MPVTDPVADFLTRVRNAVKAKKVTVDIPISNLKLGVAKILEEQKYIDGFEVVENNGKSILRLKLRYIAGRNAITGLKKISKPGLRVYSEAKSIEKILNGLGIAVISTSKGLKTDKQARTENVGGEIICHVW